MKEVKVISNNSIKSREVDKYSIEVTNNALEKVVISSSTGSKVDLHVDDKNGSLIITAKASDENH
jgi:hypothetical protein